MVKREGKREEIDSLSVDTLLRYALRGIFLTIVSPDTTPAVC